MYPPPKNLYAEFLTPSTSECDRIWRQGLYRPCQVKGKVTLGWVLIQYDWYPYKRENLDTNTCTSCKDEGRNQGDASTSQGTPTRRMLEERHGVDPSSQPSEGTSPFHILTSDFQPLEVQDRKFLLFKPPNLRFFVMSALTN